MYVLTLYIQYILFIQIRIECGGHSSCIDAPYEGITDLDRPLLHSLKELLLRLDVAFLIEKKLQGPRPHHHRLGRGQPETYRSE